MNPDFSRYAAGLLNGPYFDNARYDGPTETREDRDKAIANAFDEMLRGDVLPISNQIVGANSASKR